MRCFKFDNHAWKRYLGEGGWATPSFWNKEVFRRLEDCCGGFLFGNENTTYFALIPTCGHRPLLLCRPLMVGGSIYWKMNKFK